MGWQSFYMKKCLIRNTVIEGALKVPVLFFFEFLKMSEEKRLNDLQYDKNFNCVVY